MKREELIAAMRGKPVLKSVEIEGWGKVYLRPLTVAQIDLQQQEAKREGTDPHRFARAIARMLCDEDGALLFSETSEEDVALIAGQAWDKLRKVLEAEVGDEKNA